MKINQLLTILPLACSLIGGSHLSAQYRSHFSGQEIERSQVKLYLDKSSSIDLIKNSIQAPFGLSYDDLLSLGFRMWKNYAGGTLEGLTKWDESNADHQFMYLGIASNIWLPEGSSSIFQADWPVVAQRLKDLGCKIKPWMLEDCPWSSKEEFDADFDSKKMTWLRTHLSKKKLVWAQAFYIAERLQRSMDPNSPDSLLNGLTADQSALVQKNFNLVVHCTNPSGIYALIDYVNFKGEGRLDGAEKFNGQSWGLLQVLLNMQTPEEGADDATIINAFFESAKVTLNNRIINQKIQDPNSNEQQYWNMWVAHLSDYLLSNDEVTARFLDQAPVEASNK